jgi:CubicO group peptidase (beta-lactamase class C family)
MNEVMTHTAGFGYGLSASNAVDRAFIADQPMEKKDLPALVKRVSEIPLLAQPGEKWSYSIAVDLQGAIVEKLSGKKFGDYLEQNIFAPLAMNDSAFWLTRRQSVQEPLRHRLHAQRCKRRAAKSIPDGRARFTVRNHHESGGGGLASTLHDYVTLRADAAQ